MENIDNVLIENSLSLVAIFGYYMILDISIDSGDQV
jgi:hypothetical protein